MANSYGFSTAIVNQPVQQIPLTAVTGPSGINVDNVAVTLLFDATAALQRGLQAVIQNRGPNSIWYCYHTSGAVAPALTTANGIELVTNGKDFLDDVGGLAVWALASTAVQVSPANTRVSVGRR